MGKSTTDAKTLGIVEYLIQNVLGDGNCFFRALYQILQNADDTTRRALHIQNTQDEEEGVKHLRSFVADALRSGSYEESLTTIDTLCFLVESSSHTQERKRRKVQTQDDSVQHVQKRGRRQDTSPLMSEIHNMYPFMTHHVCSAQGKERYAIVARMVENIEGKPMYASSMEIDLVKAALAPHHITLLTISANGPMRSAEKNWSHDLGKLLENAQTKYVAVLLNRNNVHYKYLHFKAPHDGRYHAIVNREYLLRLIRMNEILEKTEKLVLLSGGKRRLIKRKEAQ